MSRNEGLSGREDIRDYGIMFEPIIEHFIPGDPDCFEAPQAKKDAADAKRLLLNRGLSPGEIRELMHDVTEEARHLTAWLSVVQPEDFNEKILQ